MKNTRKKMLLSSVAMLLVALIALGSATYAWFTINKEVKANAMTVKAATADGLQLTIKNGGSDANWVREATFSAFSTATDNVLAPISIQYATDSAMVANGYYPADAKSAGAYTSANISARSADWQEQTVVASPTSTLNNGDAKARNNWTAAYRIGIRSSNKDITGVTMNLTYADDATNGVNGNNKAGDFIRFVVVDEKTNKIVACKGDGAAYTFPVISTTPTVATTAQAADVTEVTGITAPAKASTAQYYTVYAWFEGQDAQCDDAHQSLQGALDIKFSF